MTPVADINIGKLSLFRLYLAHKSSTGYGQRLTANGLLLTTLALAKLQELRSEY
jgi:hypothetical protein